MDACKTHGNAQYCPGTHRSSQERMGAHEKDIKMSDKGHPGRTIGDGGRRREMTSRSVSGRSRRGRVWRRRVGGGVEMGPRRDIGVEGKSST